MMKLFNSAATDLRGGWQPSLSLELAFAEALEAPPVSPSLPAQVLPAGTSARPKGRSAPAHLPDATQDSDSRVSDAAASPADSGDRAAGEPAGISAGEIIKAWKQLAASLPKSQANLSALLNSVRMIDVQGGTLILGMASDVLVSKIDKPDQIEAVQKLLRDHFKVDLAIRCVVTNARGKIPADVAQDGMVAAAIQHGGEIVDMD
jgi:hypothetical protein